MAHIMIDHDNMCTCLVGDKCPIRPQDSEERCSKLLLTTAGYQTVKVTPRKVFGGYKVQLGAVDGQDQDLNLFI